MSQVHAHLLILPYKPTVFLTAAHLQETLDIF